MPSKSFILYFKKPANSVNSSDVNDVNIKEGCCVNSVNNSSSACNIDFVPKQPYHPPFQRRNSGVVNVPVSTTGLTHTHGCIMT